MKEESQLEEILKLQDLIAKIANSYFVVVEQIIKIPDEFKSYQDMGETIQKKIQIFDEWWKVLFSRISVADKIIKTLEFVNSTTSLQNIFDLLRSLTFQTGTIRRSISHFDSFIFYKQELEKISKEFKKGDQESLAIWNQTSTALDNILAQIDAQLLALQNIIDLQKNLEANNNQANNLIQQLQRTESAFIKLKEDLNIERQTIQQLMADATKLGLAQRYTQEKNTLNSEKYKWDFRFNLALFSLIGLGTLEIIVFVCSIYIEVMKKISNTPTIYLGLVPIHIAIIWFVIFFSRRRNEVNRLASDYAHKEVFASSYEAYLEEIKKLKDNGIISKEKEEEATELATKLLDSMIGVLSDNPAKSLDTKKTTDELPAKELVNLASEIIKFKGKNT